MRRTAVRRILATDFAAPDARTTLADARAALCLACGVPPGFISPLGYDHTDRGYAAVRASWVHHIEGFGFRLPVGDDPAFADVTAAHAVWAEARPDLAVGDDWLAAGWEAHERRYPDGCGQPCDLCHVTLAS